MLWPLILVNVGLWHCAGVVCSGVGLNLLLSNGHEQ